MEDAEILAVMSEDIHHLLEKVKQFYFDTPFAVANEIRPTYVSADEVHMRMELRQDHLNSNGVAHGGAVVAIIDQTFGLASNLFEPAVGQNVTISFHRPALCGPLESVSKKVSDTRSLSVFDIKVYCAGKHIASSMCTAFKTNRSFENGKKG